MATKPEGYANMTAAYIDKDGIVRSAYQMNTFYDPETNTARPKTKAESDAIMKYFAEKEKEDIASGELTISRLGKRQWKKH